MDKKWAKTMGKQKMGENNRQKQWAKKWEKTMGENNAQKQWAKTMGKTIGENNG